MIKDKNFIWNAIGTTLNSFLSLILLIIITRINGIEMSGTFSFAFSISTLLQTLTNYGGRVYQVTDIKNKYTLHEYLGSRVVTSLLGLVISIIICYLYKLNYLGYLLTIILMLIKIIETFSDVLYGQLQKNDNLKLVGISLFIKAISITIIFLVVDYFTKNIIISSIAILAITLILFIFFDIRKCDEKIKFKINTEILKKNKDIFISNFILLIILNISKFIGKIYLNEVEFGYLGIILMIPTVMLLFSQFLTTPILSTLTNYYKENNIKMVNNTCKKIINSLVVVCFFCTFLAIFLGKPVLQFLYGISFEGYVLAFVILIFAGMFNGFSTLYMNVLTIMRKTKIQVYILLIIATVISILSLILSKLYGIYGLVIAFLISMILEFIIFILVYLYYPKHLIKKERNLK